MSLVIEHAVDPERLEHVTARGHILVGCRNTALYGVAGISTPYGGHKIAVPADGVCEVPDDCGILNAGPDWYLIGGTPRTRRDENGQLRATPGEWKWFSCVPELAGESVSLPAGGKILFDSRCLGYAPADCGLDKCGYVPGKLLTDDELTQFGLRRPSEPELPAETVVQYRQPDALERIRRKAREMGIKLTTPEEVVAFTAQMMGVSLGDGTHEGIRSAGIQGQVDPNSSGLPNHLRQSASAMLQRDLKTVEGGEEEIRLPSVYVDPNSSGLPEHLAKSAGPAVTAQVAEMRQAAAAGTRSQRAQAARESARKSAV